MRSSPLILISPSTTRAGVEFHDYSLSLSDAYPRAVQAAGGIPWIMAGTPEPDVLAESVRRCDGVLLTGGDDVQPGLYARDLAPALKKTVTTADPGRDLSELQLIAEVFRHRKPLLAICRGQQVLNVAFGGSLIVDLPIQLPQGLRHNRPDAKSQIVHDIRIERDSLLARVASSERVGVNSTHHQAVDRVAAPFRVVARSDDGVVEALELGLAERQLLPYLIAVQFHPERLQEKHPEFLALFRSFTEASMAASKRPI